ncbi:MAG: outer membrane lipoprotein-sorting protein [Xanthomonadaceae bacterium]|nr:outer membrane lipoprotein-sorting protein [Xanthomonadaceae bacterium]
MQTWISKMIKFRKTVLLGTVAVTFGLLLQLKSLNVIIDPDSTLPQTHPYIATGNIIEKTFGNKFTIIIGLTVKEGTIYQEPVLSMVQRITQELQMSPAVVKANLMSLSAKRAKNISGNSEGMSVVSLMKSIPQTESEMASLKKAVQSNPAYENLLVSKDEKTTQIVAEFKKIDGGFKAIKAIVRGIVEKENNPNIEISTSGLPMFLALLEQYSSRMAFLFPLALLIIGLIHFEAFRTVQALILPLVTALLAVAWAMGFLGLMHEPFDVFNSSTPILILAIAAGHAVQILKRYYEEFTYVKKSNPELSPKEQSEKAVLQSLTKVGPVMIVACTVAALGFFSLMIFEIKSIRTFGIFTGAGVISALILELTFIPALRSMLPPPGEKEVNRESAHSFWDRLTMKFYNLAMYERKKVYTFVTLAVVILSLGGYWLKIDNSQKGYFYGKIQQRMDDDLINEKMAGTNPFYVLIEGPQEDSIKRPDVLRAMDKLQTFIETKSEIGKTLSIVNFIKKMNQSMNGDKKEFYSVPDKQELVAQYLLLYSNSGEPGDFDSYVDYGYQKAVVTAFSKTDRSSFLEATSKEIQEFTKSTFPQDIKVTIGGGGLGGVALNEIMIKEKVLNILQIMGAVFIVSSLVFRSLLAGLLILVPLVAAVMVNFGIMGLLGIPLQIATALVSAMAVGIGADYGIYMSYRMREELKQNVDEEVAIKKAFQSAGKAAIFVSTAVAGGFGVLMLSVGFMIHIWMGFLIALAMLVSSVTALTLFPALIFTLRPKFIFNERKNKMPNELKVAATSLGVLLISMHLAHAGNPAKAVTAAKPMTADEIAIQAFSISKVADSVSDSTFRLINSNGQERVRETQGQTKLIPGTNDNRRIVTFLSPSDVKGTKNLLVEHTGKDDDIWIYLPALKKVRRLAASNKSDSFAGTDFSYGDVIGHRPEEWNHKILKEEKLDGKDVYVMESTPKTDKVKENSGYSRRLGWMDKESLVALKGEFYDLNGQLLKKTMSKKIEKVDAKNNKWQPMYLEAENVQTNHKTIIEFKNYKANTGVSDDLFTARYLEKQ